MSLDFVILRLFHILGGVFWAGAALTMTGFIEPIARSTGADGARFLRTVMQRTQFSILMGAAALVNTICGILLFWDISGGLRPVWLFSLQGATLSAGSLAGIAAFVLAVAVQGRTSMRLAEVGREVDCAGDTPTPAQATELQALQARLIDSGKASAVLLVISIIGMSLARYL